MPFHMLEEDYCDASRVIEVNSIIFLQTFAEQINGQSLVAILYTLKTEKSLTYCILN